MPLPAHQAKKQSAMSITFSHSSIVYYNVYAKRQTPRSQQDAGANMPLEKGIIQNRDLDAQEDIRSGRNKVPGLGTHSSSSHGDLLALHRLPLYEHRADNRHGTASNGHVECLGKSQIVGR